DLISGHRITVVIYVAARLGVADLLAEGPKTSGELAQHTGVDERSLRRLLRALVSLGICTQPGKDQFAVTAIGDYYLDSLNAFHVTMCELGQLTLRPVPSSPYGPGFGLSGREGIARRYS